MCVIVSFKNNNNKEWQKNQRESQHNENEEKSQSGACSSKV